MNNSSQASFRRNFCCGKYHWNEFNGICCITCCAKHDIVNSLYNTLHFSDHCISTFGFPALLKFHLITEPIPNHYPMLGSLVPVLSDTNPSTHIWTVPWLPSPLITSLFTSMIYGSQLIEADQPLAWWCHVKHFPLCTGPSWGESIGDYHGSKCVGELLWCKCLIHHMGIISNAATLKWKDCLPNCH